MLVEKQQRPKHRGTGGVGHGRPKDLEFYSDSDKG